MMKLKILVGLLICVGCAKPHDEAINPYAECSPPTIADVRSVWFPQPDGTELLIKVSGLVCADGCRLYVSVSDASITMHVCN